MANQSPMGCKPSKRKVGVWFNNMSVQDETLSFQAKIEAIKFILKSTVSRHAFQQYLEPKHSAMAHLRCYTNLETVKKESNENIAHQISTTLRKFRELNRDDDELSQSAIDITSVNFHGQPPSVALDLSEKLNTLQNLDLLNITRNALLSAVVAAQELLLGELAVHFEGFLKSTHYKEWVDMQLQIERQSGKFQENPRQPANNNTSTSNSTSRTTANGSRASNDRGKTSPLRKRPGTLVLAQADSFGDNINIGPS